MIYLDNAGTTKPLDDVKRYVQKIQDEFYYNPSSGYTMAHKTRELINIARQSVAESVGAKPENVVFTSCATEANNQIIRSLVNSNKKNEYIFSEAEHPSVYNVALDLKNNGYTVRFVSLLKDGTVNIDELLDMINENTRFVSIMCVSNETGAYNDIDVISKLVKEKNKNVFFHSDCVQALGKVKINLKKSMVDAITISSHKINGIKGAGALVVKDTTKLRPFIIGGGQENNFRSGTENVDAICGFGKACENIDLNYNIKEMSDYIKTTLKNALGDDIIVVSGDKCIPHTISIIFKKLKGEVFVRYLDGFGVVCSKGSACSTKKSGNRVLENMGYSKDEIIGNVRISLNRLNTFDEIVKACDIIIEKYGELKERMKLWKK